MLIWNLREHQTVIVSCLVLFLASAVLLIGCGSETSTGTSTPSSGSNPPSPSPAPDPAPAPTPPVPPPSPPGNTGLPFSSGLETGNFSEWNGGASHAIAVSNQGCVSGAYCARIQLTQGTHSDGYAEHRFGDFFNIGLTKVEEVYLRLYSKIDGGYVWPNDSQKIAIINLTDGTSSLRRYQVYIYANSYGEYAVDHSYIDAWRFFGLGQNVGTPLSVRPGQWDKLKLYVRLNTPGVSNGVVMLWINDALKLSHNGLNLREGTAYGMGKLIVGSYAQDASGSNGVQWWDSVTLSHTDPG